MICDPQLSAALESYSEESAIPELPRFNPNFDMYKNMEAIGAIQIAAARLNGLLIGFVIVLISEIPHFSTTIATTESLFVSKEARKSGAGLKLLKEAELIAKERGAIGLFISAPANGKLHAVLSKSKDFQNTNQVFYKGFV